MTELCLYQTVHVARGRARNVAAHAALLDAASRALFGRPYAPDPARLAARIEALAAAERYPAGVSGFVRLELTPEGGERLLAAGISLYDGYALRSLSPAAVTLRYDPLCPEAPTSAREAAELLAARLAALRGAAAAGRCDAEERLLTADGAPLFTVRGHTVYTAPAPASVEGCVAREAVRTAGLTLREEPLRRRERPRAEELFYADHRGITALSRCDGQPLMTLVAERVAEALEGLFPKK